jgi:hypothetical protein
MKRLVLGLLLASLTLGIGLGAGAVPYLQDPNVIYSSNIAGTEAWVLIYNDYNAGLTLNAAYLTGFQSFRIVADGSFIQQYDGTVTALTAAIVAGDLVQSQNKMHRLMLGTLVGPGGFVVLHLQPTGNGTQVKLFEASLIDLSIF